ncbi:outer membrane protein assembly factor BamB family protein [Tateyamaria pelophila]|uniref:outer membrane protein assembly factor BamB family protein n=1 Tax=Tateyamaria pelophila TaxID=328415 RepID=UPI001CC11CB3|nr:PQQ-like beta-propeller repeat protein [Tateyamaria pelophila]
MAETRIRTAPELNATGRVRRGYVAVGAFAVLATILSACTEPDVILPGKREPITAVFSSSEAEEATQIVRPVNAAPDIRLPAQVANADAAQNRGTQAFRTDNPRLSTSLTPVWSVGIGEGDSRRHRIVADPVVSGGRVFTLDALTLVSAISTSGGVIWQRNVLPDGADEADATGGGLAVEGNVLYVASGFGAVSALDATTGATLWTQDLETTGAGAPMIYGDLLYVIAGDMTGWAIDKRTGRMQWQITGAASASNVLGAPTPVLAGDLVVFAFGSGEMQAVFRKGGLQRWGATVVGERRGRALANIGDVTGQPIEANGVIYAGNQSGRVVAVNAASGARIWSAKEGAIGRVVPVGGSVFFISDRNELLRLNAQDGSRIWGVPLPNFVKDRPRRVAEVFANHGPILAGGRLIVASSDGVIRSFDPKSGALLGRTEIASGATTAPVVAGQTLYIVSRDGRLVAYR